MEETAERDEEEESPTSSSKQLPKRKMEAGAAHTFRILLSTDNHLGYKEKDPSGDMTPSSHLKKCYDSKGRKC